MRAEGIGRREQDGWRIASHYISDIIRGRPAGKPPALYRVVDQRLHHVAFTLGVEERLQLHGIAIQWSRNRLP